MIDEETHKITMEFFFDECIIDPEEEIEYPEPAISCGTKSSLLRLQYWRTLLQPLSLQSPLQTLMTSWIKWKITPQSCGAILLSLTSNLKPSSVVMWMPVFPIVTALHTKIGSTPALIITSSKTTQQVTTIRFLGLR